MDIRPEPKLSYRAAQDDRVNAAMDKVQGSCFAPQDQADSRPTVEDPLGFSMCGMAG